jgi:hypothetical protein
MKVPILLLVFAVITSGSTGAESGGRFSQALSVAERAELGLARLNSDQVAVLDALVRRDVAGRPGARAATEGTTFSQRLTADERRNAGIALMTASEVIRLDGLIDLHAASVLARQLLAPLPVAARARMLDPSETTAKNERKIHGEFSLGFGFGSGGYSERTGSMVLRLDDPARRYSIAVGYSETRIKGGPMYLDGDYYRPDPLPRSTLPDGTAPR